MRIFFTTPYSGKQQYQPFIDEIIDVLHAHEVIIDSPENTETYQKALHEYEAMGISPSRAHYEFVTRGIVDADLVIIEASQESLRMGHEITMSLLFGKPTLVVSQNKNYADYITHQLLTGVLYQTKDQLHDIIRKFITKDRSGDLQAPTNTPTIGAAVDHRRLTTLSSMRQQALLDSSDYGKFADLAEHDPEAAYERAKRIFSDLPVEKAWSNYAYIYQEDVPDYVFDGILDHILALLDKYGVKKDDQVVDAFTHGGMVARYLAKSNYTNLTSFSSSRQMLSQTFKLCADIPEISIVEASPDSLRLSEQARAIIWIDYTTNFALTEKDLEEQLQNLVNNLQPGGYMIFDVRTPTGWDAYFFSEKVATFATKNFQRIWLQTPDHTTKLINFDIMIRTKQNTGEWGQWHREQLVDRMWSLDEVRTIVGRLKQCELTAIYNDDFQPMNDNHEPNLAYFVVKRQ